MKNMQGFFRKVRLWGMAIFTVILLIGVMINLNASPNKDNKINSTPPGNSSAPATQPKPKMNFNL